MSAGPFSDIVMDLQKEAYLHQMNEFERRRIMELMNSSTQYQASGAQFAQVMPQSPQPVSKPEPSKVLLLLEDTP